jgi:ubiquinol-cytochrome c reductase cytochrome c subunit
MKRLIVVGIVAMMPVVAVRGAAQSPAPAAQPRAGDVEKGRTLFVASGCYQCHNYEGQGGTAGARLAPNPIPYRAFVAYVRAPRGDMPPYTAKVMSDQDLADVYAYLRARPRPPANIPLLRDQQ